MARVAIPVTSLAAYGGQATNITWTPGSADNHKISHPGGGEIILALRNASAGAITTTVLAVAAPRTMQMATNLTVAVNAGAQAFVAIPSIGFDQGGGEVHVNVSAHADMHLHAVRALKTPVA